MLFWMGFCVSSEPDVLKESEAELGSRHWEDTLMPEYDRPWEYKHVTFNLLGGERLTK